MRSWAEGAVCPATGKAVMQSWDDELLHLAPVPNLPEPFDVAVTRPVHKDCTVRFEGRTYSVPFEYVDREVEVRGCAGRVGPTMRRRAGRNAFATFTGQLQAHNSPKTASNSLPRPS